MKSPSGVPPSASTPKTADQPEQDSYKRRPPFGNRTSTEASDAATTTSALTSQSAALLKALVIAGTKIDSICPNHPRPARTPHPAPAYKGAPAKSIVRSQQIHDGPKPRAATEWRIRLYQIKGRLRA